MSNSSIKRIAEIICELDPHLQSPHAVVFTDQGAVEAWRTRVDMAKVILKAIQQPDAGQAKERRSGGRRSALR